MFFNEKTYVGVVASGDDLLKLPIVYISFGPIKTNTHELGAHGWKLRMHQSTVTMGLDGSSGLECLTHLNVKSLKT